MHSIEPLKLAALFVFHIIIGILLFIVLGAAAKLLAYVGTFLDSGRPSYYIVTAFNALELVLFFADFVCLVLLLLSKPYFSSKI